MTRTLRQDVRHLQQSLDQRLHSLGRTITPDTVHDARTSARRLRVVLRAFKRQLDPSTLQKYTGALRYLTHTLDAMRDADVALHTLSQLSVETTATTGEEMDGWKALIARNRSRAVRDLESALNAGSWTVLRVKLRKFASDPGLIVESLKTMSALVPVVLKRQRRRLRRELRYRGKSPRRLHRIRLRIKTLRYLLEQYASMHSAWVREEIRQLEEIQDCLGDLHDGWCLGRSIRQQKSCEGSAVALSADIKTRQRDLVRRFRRHRRILRRIWRAEKRFTGP